MELTTLQNGHFALKGQSVNKAVITGTRWMMLKETEQHPGFLR